jgi:hypothetical protein
MTSFRKNFGIKTIGDKNFYNKQLETLSAVNRNVVKPTINPIKVVTTPEFTVTEESIILTKNIEECLINLNNNSNDSVVIKSLTNTSIKPINSKIDEIYDILTIGKGACVELQKIDGGWFILSSDGIKLD